MKKNRLYCLTATLANIILGICLAEAETNTKLDVIVSIKPIHSLVSGIMQDIGKPYLLIDGANSPHTFTLKPSHAARLKNADIIFWMGEKLEPTLQKPIRIIAATAISFNLLNLREINKFPFRRQTHFATKLPSLKTAPILQNQQNYIEGTVDSHIWLDPINAIILVKKITQVLSEADPRNARSYQARSVSLEKKLLALTQRVNKNLANVKNAQLLFFHDAYQYFEKRFRLVNASVMFVSPEAIPSAARVRKIRKVILEKGTNCVFVEPQFPSKLVSMLIAKTNIKLGQVDPLGSNITLGPNQYFLLLDKLSNNISNCILRRIKR